MEPRQAKYLLWDALTKVGSQRRLADRLGISVPLLLRYVYDRVDVPDGIASRVREILKSEG
jgi:hypothetical protein